MLYEKRVKKVHSNQGYNYISLDKKGSTKPILESDVW